MTIPANSTSTLNGGTLQANSIDVEGTLTGFGTITANVITNNGTIQAKSSHTLLIKISGSISGTGTLEVTNNTTLTLNGPVGSGQTVKFDIGGGAITKLVLGDPSHFQGQILNLQKNDQIDLTNINPATAQVSITQPPSFDPITNITTLVITDGTTTDTLKLVGDYTGSTWHFSTDGGVGTFVVDPPASTTTADAITIPDASTTTIVSTATTVASTTTTVASTATSVVSTTTTDATMTLVAKTSTKQRAVKQRPPPPR